MFRRLLITVNSIPTFCYRYFDNSRVAIAVAVVLLLPIYDESHKSLFLCTSHHTSYFYFTYVGHSWIVCLRCVVWRVIVTTMRNFLPKLENANTCRLKEELDTKFCVVMRHICELKFDSYNGAGHAVISVLGTKSGTHVE